LSVLIGLDEFVTSQTNISPPIPQETIFLLELLNFASYTLSLWPLNLVPTEPFFESQICTTVSGLAESNWFPSLEY
jgi:hypothetical protein